MVKIVTRLWDITGLNLVPDFNLLYKRPRVDYRISEYIFAYINKNILEENKIMQTGNYDLSFSFNQYHKDDMKFHKDTTFCTENTKFDFHLYNETEGGIKYKCILVFCWSTRITEKIEPKEYANIVYDMIGAFLTSKYKKITKELMDKNRNGIDYDFIQSYKFPAKFEDQKYMMDDPGIWKNSEIKNGKEANIIELNIKEKYIEHYGY